MCDGSRDCDNGADEDRCETIGACPKHFFRCGGGHGGDCVRDDDYSARVECDATVSTTSATTTDTTRTPL